MVEVGDVAVARGALVARGGGVVPTRGVGGAGVGAGIAAAGGGVVARRRPGEPAHCAGERASASCVRGVERREGKGG